MDAKLLGEHKVRARDKRGTGLVGPGRAKSSVIISNKKAYFDYEVLEKFETGVVFTGPEVKSVKEGRVQLKGSFVTVINGRVLTENLHISHYRYSPIEGYNPLRRRELLLKRKEIDYLAGQASTKGFTIVPLELLLKNNLIKMVIGICRGKKMHDKRDVMRKRAVSRDIAQGLKKFGR